MKTNIFVSLVIFTLVGFALNQAVLPKCGFGFHCRLKGNHDCPSSHSNFDKSEFCKLTSSRRLQGFVAQPCDGECIDCRNEKSSKRILQQMVKPNDYIPKFCKCKFNCTCASSYTCKQCPKGFKGKESFTGEVCENKNSKKLRRMQAMVCNGICAPVCSSQKKRRLQSMVPNYCEKVSRRLQNKTKKSSKKVLHKKAHKKALKVAFKKVLNKTIKKVKVQIKKIKKVKKSSKKAQKMRKFTIGQAKGKQIPKKVAKAVDVLLKGNNGAIKDTKKSTIGVYHYLLVYVQRTKKQGKTHQKILKVKVKKSSLKKKNMKTLVAVRPKKLSKKTKKIARKQVKKMVKIAIKKAKKAQKKSTKVVKKAKKVNKKAKKSKKAAKKSKKVFKKSKKVVKKAKKAKESKKVNKK